MELLGKNNLLVSDNSKISHYLVLAVVLQPSVTIFDNNSKNFNIQSWMVLNLTLSCSYIVSFFMNYKTRDFLRGCITFKIASFI